MHSKRLRKPLYDPDQAEARKRSRNDWQETKRLEALRKRQDEEAANAAAGAGPALS
jgi:hypothetical protein